jgi:type I restriction enzyme, S subunit
MTPTTVGDYVTLIRGITYKGNLVGKPGPALLGLGSIHPGGGFREGDYKTYGGECPPKLMLTPGDLFASLKGATKDGKMIGSVARVPSSVPSGRLTQDTVKLEFRDPDQEKANFLYWVLRTPQYRDYCAGRAMGSAVVALSRDDFLSFPVPPITSIRIGIVELLEALDDKIELNRRMNATLEAMARVLFQSWFVDFDPVRAKLDSRQTPGLDPATSALFPNDFEESGLGHIPKGWRAGSIYQIANVIYGAPFASSLFNAQKLGKPLIRIRDLPNESPAVFTTEVHPKGYLLKPGDIAVGMDGEFRAYLWAGVESWLNQRVCVFAPKPGYSAAFVRNSIFAPLAQVEATETATTVIHIGKNDIDRFTVVIPDAPVAEAFKQQCQPWYDQIVVNKQQSRTLAAVRDSLLPKLLSGELTLKEIKN